MKNKGSITIYICLTMILILSLITTGIRSAVVANARVAMVSSMDLGLYSLFGQYDRDFLEQYGLLFVDGGYKSADLQMGRIYQELKEDVEYNLFAESFANGRRPWVETGAIKGYSLATDGQGSVFKGQVVSYMQETIGAQGIALLMEKVAQEGALVQQQESDKEQSSSGGDIEDYEAAKKEYETIQAEAMAQGEDDGIEPGTQVAEVDPGFKNPIEVIKVMKELGTLNLVLPNIEAVSKKTIDIGAYASQRTLQQGMGVIPVSGDTQGAVAEFLFQEYMIGKCSSYLSPAPSMALEYQLEYLLMGKDSDLENLKGVANRLLLMREAANFLYIMADSSKRAQVSGMAATIATSLGIPLATPVIEIVLMSVWAFGESIIDVRALLRGEKVPLVKNVTSWQLALDNLANLPELLNGELGSQSQGLDYKEYLRILLTLKSGEEKLARAMDVVEMTMQSKRGREEFRLDSCLYSLEVNMQMGILTNVYDAQRSYGYDM